MQNLAAALQVKDSTIFELLHQTFYERDFIFFPQLTAHLGRITGCAAKDAEAFGKLSELIYLSSIIHFSLTEHTESTAQLRAEKQMPVLLGDLLYGRFISALIDAEKEAYLPVYIAYLKQFNAEGVDELEHRIVYTTGDMLHLLTVKTAEVMAQYAMDTANGAAEIHDWKEPLIAEAEQYLQKQWDLLRGEKIESMEALETLLQREFCQEAMVC